MRRFSNVLALTLCAALAATSLLGLAGCGRKQTDAGDKTKVVLN